MDAMLLVYQEDLSEKVGLQRFFDEGAERVTSALDDVLSSDDPLVTYETPDGLFACECVATRFGSPPPSVPGSLRPEDLVGTSVSSLAPLDVERVRRAIERVANTLPIDDALLQKARKAAAEMAGEFTGIADDFAHLSFDEPNDEYRKRRVDLELEALFDELLTRLEKAPQ